MSDDRRLQTPRGDAREFRLRLHGRWPWRWLVLSRIVGQCAFSFTPDPGAETNGRISIDACSGRYPGPFSIPIGEGGVSRILIATTEAASRPGPASASWLVLLDQSGAPLQVPPIPAGFTTRFARPGDRRSLWWDLNEIKEEADQWGVGIERRMMRPVASERDLGVRLPFGLDSVDFFNLVIFVAMFVFGILSLLAIMASAHHGLHAAIWILAGFMSVTGLAAGLLRFLLTTGWMETDGGRRRHRSGRSSTTENGPTS